MAGPLGKRFLRTAGTMLGSYLDDAFRLGGNVGQNLATSALQAGKAKFAPQLVGKTGKEMESFGDLRRFDLGGLPIRIYDDESDHKDWLKNFRSSEKPQTRFDLEIPTSQMYASQINELRDMPVWSADPQRMGTKQPLLSRRDWDW